MGKGRTKRRREGRGGDDSKWMTWSCTAGTCFPVPRATDEAQMVEAAAFGRFEVGIEVGVWVLI